MGDGLEKGADDGGGDDGDGGDEEEGDQLEDVEVRFGGSNLCYVFGWCLEKCSYVMSAALNVWLRNRNEHSDSGGYVSHSSDISIGPICDIKSATFVVVGSGGGAP